MTEDQARDLAVRLLNIFFENHIKENWAPPFIIDMCTDAILETIQTNEALSGISNVIRKLVFSNIQKDPENPYEYYIYYGIYKISFQGGPDSTLAQMNDYFMEKIGEIAGVELNGV